jgi:hypothetical protein
VEALRVFDEPGIAICRFLSGVSRERRAHLRNVGHEVERRAVIEERAPLRIERHEIERFVHVASGFSEDARQDRRKRQDRRAHVEPETILLEHGGLASQPCVLLEDDDGVASRGKGASEARPPRPPPITAILFMVMLVRSACACARFEEVPGKHGSDGQHRGRGARRRTQRKT